MNYAYMNTQMQTCMFIMGLSIQALQSDVGNRGIKWKVTAGKIFNLPFAYMYV